MAGLDGRAAGSMAGLRAGLPGNGRGLDGRAAGSMAGLRAGLPASGRIFME
jgi:hypothetical protein